jgi:hypothetical protein
LPIASGVGAQQLFFHVAGDIETSNTVQLLPSGSDTINGEPSLTLEIGDSVSFTSDGDVTWLDPSRTTAGLLEQTAASTDMYVDTDTGDDSNDGSSWTNAKATAQAGHDTLPHFIRHNSTLHVRGDLTDEPLTVTKDVAYGVKFVVSFFNGYEQDENEYSDTTVGGTGNLVDVGLSPGPEGWSFGSWLRILSGTHSGVIMALRGDTGDGSVLKMVRSLTPGIGAGVSVETVEPVTKYSSTSPLSFGVKGCTGGGEVWIQHVRLGAEVTLEIEDNQAKIVLAGIHIYWDYTTPPIVALRNASLEFSDSVVDTTTYAETDVHTTNLGVWDGYSFQPVIVSGCSSFKITGALLRNFEVYDATLDSWSGFGMHGFEPVTDGICKLVNVDGLVGGMVVNDDSFVQLQWSTLTLEKSSLSIGAGCDIGESQTGNGIDAKNSHLKLVGDVTSTANNDGFGVYAHSLSLVETTGTPTITGDSGDFSLDGTTASGWSTDVPATDLTTLSRVI